MKNYGFPYKGSKNRLAEKIVKLFPDAENFYDLFCGGCAITHRALIENRWKNYFINDIDSRCPKLFLDAINGKFKNETRWISREDFYNLKDDDGYVAFCWSFGNNGNGYLYSKEIEPWKKACHYAIVFDDFSLLKELCPEVYDVTKKALDGIKNIKKRRLAFGPAVIKELKRLGDWSVVENNPLYKSAHWRGGKISTEPMSVDLQSLESLQSLERLQSLESLQRPEQFSTDYQNIEIKKDSVIYCDIPYEGKDRYNGIDFDFERFYSWCEKQTEPLFISSYKMPEDRFVCIATFEHRSILSATANNKVLEKVFIPKHQLEII